MPNGSVKVTSAPEPQATASLKKPVRVGNTQLPSALVALATPRRFTASDPLPSGGVILSFRLNKQFVPAGTTPFLASLDTATGRWVPVLSSYDAETGVVSAHVLHFSIWAPLGWVKSRIVAMFKGALLSLFSLAGNGATPFCGGQTVTVTDSKPHRGIGACAAVTASSQVDARIVNQRPYAIDVLYPVAAHVDAPSGDPFAQLGADITNLAANWHHRVLLPGGGEAHASIPLAAGQQAEFATESDGEAYLFGILGTAIRMLVQITGGVAVSTAKALIDELDSLTCLGDAVDAANTLSLSLATAQKIGSAAFDCLSAAAKGVSEVLFTVASIVASLAVELVAGVWSAIDAVTGDASHNILLIREMITVRIAEDADPYYSSGAYRPASVGLAGDGTYNLTNMSWSAWTSTEAVGTGTALIDDCNPSCAAGHIYHVPVIVKFTNPAYYCRATPNGPKSARRYFWSRVYFTYPQGLPAALGNPVQNPWIFSGLIDGAGLSCQ